MIKLDKKCLRCPVRSYALKSVAILRKLSELHEEIFDVMDDFECNIVDYYRYNEEVIKCKL